MFHSKRCLALLVFFSLLTALFGQALMLSAAPHRQSMCAMPHHALRRIARSLQRRLDRPQARPRHVSRKPA